MNYILYILLLIVNLVLFINCNNTKIDSNLSHQKQIQIPHWFVGTWQNKTTESVFTETWKHTTDSLYNAISTVVVGKDTVFYEEVSLQQTYNEWNYVVSVKSQNNEQPVAFKLISFTETQLVFENNQHDFPTKITYTQINNDSIVAEISGVMKGKKKNELFPMKRISK